MFDLFPINSKKRFIKTKVRNKRFLLYLNRCTSQTLKRWAPKAYFSSIYIIGPNYLNQSFLFHVITWRHFFIKIYPYPAIFVWTSYCYFLWKKIEKSPCFLKKSAQLQYNVNPNLGTGWGILPPPPAGFPLITQKRQKL